MSSQDKSVDGCNLDLRKAMLENGPFLDGKGNVIQRMGMAEEFETRTEIPADENFANFFKHRWIERLKKMNTREELERQISDLFKKIPAIADCQDEFILVMKGIMEVRELDKFKPVVRAPMVNNNGKPAPVASVVAQMLNSRNIGNTSKIPVAKEVGNNNLARKMNDVRINRIPQINENELNNMMNNLGNPELNKNRLPTYLSGLSTQGSAKFGGKRKRKTRRVKRKKRKTTKRNKTRKQRKRRTRKKRKLKKRH